MIKKDIVDMKYGYIIVNETYYEIDSKDGKPIFKPVSKETIKEKQKLTKDIVEKLVDSLDGKKVLNESVMKLSLKDTKNLHNALFNSKRKVKPRTRQDHCVDLKVGNFVLPIVE